MSSKADITKTQIVWQGRTIEITHEPNWLNMHHDHIEVRTLTPAKDPLPITQTGYRSHFVDPEQLAEHGGPNAFVRQWLNHEAASPAWKKTEAKALQGDLFA